MQVEIENLIFKNKSVLDLNLKEQSKYKQLQKDFNNNKEELTNL